MPPTLPTLLPLLLLLLLPTRARPDRLVWLGAVTPTSFRLHLHLNNSVTTIALSTTPTLTPPLISLPATAPSALPPDPSIYNPLRRFLFTSLTPSTKYYIFALLSPSAFDLVASIRTFPPANAPSPLRVALASCQWSPTWDRVFPDILARFHLADRLPTPLPFFFLHMGDLAYSDISRNDPALYERALRTVLVRPRVAKLFSAIPVPYMYDDHDYGPNNAGFDSPSRPAALRNYRALVPSYPLPSADASYHAFTVASVRFILMDLRANARRPPGNTTLGDEQREWLFKEFENASAYDVVVWVTSKPWIGKSDPTKDSWAGFPQERRLIADKIADLGVRNMVAVAGDAHMLAVDNGSNSDYSRKDGVPAGFPVFQAAPLGHAGTSKGGPYSEGCKAFRAFPNYHYGILDITKVGEPDGPCVEFSGYKAGDMDDPLIQFKKCGVLGGVKGGGGMESSCSLKIFPAWVWLLVVLASILVVLLIGGGIGLCVRCRRKKKKADEWVDVPEQVFVSSRSDDEKPFEPTEAPSQEKTWLS